MGEKRKSDHRPPHELPQKKSRSERGPSSNEVLSQDLPALPSIAARLDKAVFTHASIAVQDPDSSEMVNYERLEFLGDAQLELMASQVIFDRYNSSTPGKMSSVRESLLRNEVLSRFSRAYHLDKKLKIAFGHDQPRDMTKIQADVFEAYVAAVVLTDPNHHRGFDRAKAWVEKLWDPILSNMGMRMVVPDVKSKEALSKLVLVPGVKLNYTDERPPVVNKAKGVQTYFIGVFLNGWGYDNKHLGSGEGESKNAAGQEAARQAMQNPILDEIKTKRKAYLAEREKQKQAEAEAIAADEDGGVKLTD